MSFGKNFSAAKFAANKKNARKSTGPKATQGKPLRRRTGSTTDSFGENRGIRRKVGWATPGTFET